MNDSTSNETSTADDVPTLKLTPITAVRLETPGVKACGQFKHGEIYKVGDGLSLEEAHRLVDAKGFKKLTASQVTAAEKAAAD